MSSEEQPCTGRERLEGLQEGFANPSLQQLFLPGCAAAPARPGAAPWMLLGCKIPGSWREEMRLALRNEETVSDLLIPEGMAGKRAREVSGSFRVVEKRQNSWKAENLGGG